MRKESSILVLTISLIIIPCGKIHGWGITYTHPALTQYAEGGSELASYCNKLLIDSELTWDFNQYYPAITARLEEAEEAPGDIERSVPEWIRAGCKIERSRVEGGYSPL